MYQFSVAAITDYHGLSGLKQHPLIASQFGRSGIWVQGDSA